MNGSLASLARGVPAGNVAACSYFVTLRATRGNDKEEMVSSDSLRYIATVCVSAQSPEEACHQGLVGFLTGRPWGSNIVAEAMPVSL